MSNVIPFTLRLISAPLSITPRMDTLLRIYTSRLEDHPKDLHRKRIPASQALDPSTRVSLEQRREELRSWLTATPGYEVEDVVLSFLMGWKQYSGSTEEAEIEMMLYAEAVSSRPTWAIEKARLRFAQDECQGTWKNSDRPSTAQLASECRSIVQPFRTELHRLNIVLDAEIYEDRVSIEEREEVLAYARAAVAQMHAKSAAAELKEEKSPVEIAQRSQAHDQLRKCMESASNAETQSDWVHTSSLNTVKSAAEVGKYYNISQAPILCEEES